MKNTLFGNLETDGIQVFVDGDRVIIEDDATRQELPDTPENRASLIEQAKAIIREWKRERDW